MIQSCERVSLDLSPKGSATLTKPFCGGGFSCPSDCCSVVVVVVVVVVVFVVFKFTPCK